MGSAQRDRVWHFLTQALAGRPNSKVLECNCGTGADALWLAGQGCQVLATDVAPQMVAVTQAKTQQAGLKDRIETTVCSMQGIGTNPVINRSAPFDLMLSNFGGLNCLSPDEIRQLNTNLQTVMAPGAVLALVVMSRFSWWETLYFLLKGKPRTAFRRLQSRTGNSAARCGNNHPDLVLCTQRVITVVVRFSDKKMPSGRILVAPILPGSVFSLSTALVEGLAMAGKKIGCRLVSAGSRSLFFIAGKKKC